MFSHFFVQCLSPVFNCWKLMWRQTHWVWKYLFHKMSQNCSVVIIYSSGVLVLHSWNRKCWWIFLLATIVLQKCLRLWQFGPLQVKGFYCESHKLWLWLFCVEAFVKPWIVMFKSDTSMGWFVLLTVKLRRVVDHWMGTLVYLLLLKKKSAAPPIHAGRLVLNNPHCPTPSALLITINHYNL